MRIYGGTEVFITLKRALKDRQAEAMLIDLRKLEI